MRSAASPVDITVMICTWNNCRRLGETLQALTGCGPRSASWQLVVVNNNCADATDATVRQHEAALPLVLTHESRPGLSKARNRGLAVSRGSLVVFTDDDVTPARGWLDAYWDACRAHPRCFFGGPVRSRFDGPAPDPRLVPFAPASVVGLDFGRAERPLSDDEYFIGPNWACPRAHLDRVGGFDEARGLDPSSGAVRVGEESDLMRRLREGGVGGVYLPDAGIVHHVSSAKCTVAHIGGRWEASAYDEVPGVCRARTCRASSGIPGGSSRGSFGPPAWPAGVASPAATGSRPTWNSAGRWERCAPSGTTPKLQFPTPNSRLPIARRVERNRSVTCPLGVGSWRLGVDFFSLSQIAPRRTPRLLSSSTAASTQRSIVHSCVGRTSAGATGAS